MIGKVPFDDIRIPPEEYGDFRDQTPLGSVPVAEIDGEMVAQSNAILRYFGCITDMYPKDSFKALLTDQIIDTISDFNNPLLGAHGDTDEELKAATEKALNVGGERYFGGAQRMIEKINSGKKFIFGDEPTIADISVAGSFMLLKSGFVKFAPSDGLDQYTRMKEIYDAIVDIHEVQKYLEKYPLPNA